MMALSPKEAASRIRAGKLAGQVRVKGRLDLSNYPDKQLPNGLHCYDLDLRGSKVVELPADLRVENRLLLDGSLQLESLPVGFTTGSISLRNCTGLTALPEGFSTWFLDMTGCTSFEVWPEKGVIEAGAVILRGCTALSYLPRWLGRIARLDLSGCVQIAEIPNGVSVSSWVDIGGTKVTRLPESMAGASLRWRGVRIDERIAFRPDELTAKEALTEKNVELRRVIIERMGYMRFAKEAQAKVLDRDKDPGGERQLLSIDLREDEPLVCLSCFCPSTGRQYFIRVPPNMRTCHQAAAWMAGFDNPSRYKPQIET